MALNEFKFDPETGFKDASAFPDPTNETETRAQLMVLHEQTRNFINALINTLNSNGGGDLSTDPIDGIEDDDGNPITTITGQLQWLLENKITGGDEIKALRINEFLQTEYLKNNGEWDLLLSGHRILDKDGTEVPPMPFLKFSNSSVRTESNTTVVEGIKGDTGATGPAGPQGIQGNQGLQGIQGEKGEQGQQGIQGEQGIQGIQGPKGDKGDQGQIGPQGQQGVQGPKGEPGTSSAVAPQAGFYSLQMESNGDLYVVYPDDETAPTFQYEKETGNLYVVLDGQEVLVGNVAGPQGVKGDPGNDGVSPTVAQTQIDDGWKVTITDATGPHEFTLVNGVSTTISVTPIEGGHTVTITDKDGDHTFNVMDGAKGDQGDQGVQGPQGEPGNDGFSPTVATEDVLGGKKVTITDATGPHEFTVLDGAKGDKGDQGIQGIPGDDGFSPTVETTPVSGGTQVTITDADGPHTFNVENGAGIPTGGTTGQYLRKTENGTEWSDIEAVTEIDDSQPQSTTTTFSAKSISDMFDALEDNVTAGDTALETKINAKPSINDTTPSATTTYSGNKIDSLVNGIIDDNDTTATDSTWSAQKIQSQINLGDYNFYYLWTNNVQTVSGLDFTVEINSDSVTFQDNDIVIALPGYDNEPNKIRLLETGGWIFKSADVGTKTFTLTAFKKAPPVGAWLSTRILIIRRKGA